MTLTQLVAVVIGGGDVDTGGEVLTGVSTGGVTGDGDTADAGAAGAGEPPPPPHQVAATADTMTRVNPNGRGEKDFIELRGILDQC